MQAGAETVQAVHAFFLLLIDAQDVFTVDGGDERLRKIPDYLTVQNIRLFFKKSDFFMHAVHIGHVFKHFNQQPRHAAQKAVLLLQHGEKRCGFGQQRREHPRSLGGISLHGSLPRAIPVDVPAVAQSCGPPSFYPANVYSQRGCAKTSWPGQIKLLFSINISPLISTYWMYYFYRKKTV